MPTTGSQQYYGHLRAMESERSIIEARSWEALKVEMLHIVNIMGAFDEALITAMTEDMEEVNLEDFESVVSRTI
jgi:hypothetical protein